VSEIPQKSFYKVNEVCQYTDTQPYVLRFWESEFPQLAPHKNKTGQRVYTRRDVDLILRIKRLLHDEEYTIAGARARLDEEDGNRTPLAFLPDGDSGMERASAATATRAGLFESEPPKAQAPPEPPKKAKSIPVVPHAVSALETPFIPEPPVTDPTHLRQELRAERERADALHAKLEQARLEQDAAVRDREEAQRALEHQRDTIAMLQRDLESARGKTAKLEAAEAALAELQGKSGEAGRLQKDLQRQEEALADAKSALETERQTLVHERAAADALRVRLRAVEATAAEVRERLDAAEAESQQWRARAQRASVKVAEVASSLREVLAP
jgi:DNA-binding transcriptional MerR regulator